MPGIAYVPGLQAAETFTRVANACKKHWPQWKSDCSGFVKAVAAELGYNDLVGQANDIIDKIQKQPWRKLASGKEAAQQAGLGKFVIAGHKHNPNGHVVVIIPGGPVYGKYPYAYWGSLHNTGNHLGGQYSSVNYAFPPGQRDHLIYACR